MTDEKREQVRDLFDGVAGTYDAVGVEFFKPIAQRLAAELAPRPGEVALDVGCGRGAVLVPLTDAVGPTGRVVGIDLSPRMVQATAADVAAAGLTAEVIVGDAQHPNLPGQSMDVCANEIFGPVVGMQRYDEIPDAFAAANDTRYGLQTGVFTNDLSTALDAAHALDFGGVCVNEVPSWRADQMPYGGNRDSGNTKEGPAWAVREMTEERMVVIQR